MVSHVSPITLTLVVHSFKICFMFCLTVDYDHDSWVAGLMGPREVAIEKAIGHMPKMFVGLIMLILRSLSNILTSH